MISGETDIMAMSNNMLPSYEMEEGEIQSAMCGNESMKTIVTEIKNIRQEMEEMEKSPCTMMESCDNGGKMQEKGCSLKVGDITFDEDGFRAMWIALIQQERKIDELESALNALSSGEGKGMPRITRDEMLNCIKHCIEELATNYGVSKQLLRKVVSQKLGIDIRNSNYLQKKFNAVLKHGVDVKVLWYDPKDQMYHNML